MKTNKYWQIFCIRVPLINLLFWTIPKRLKKRLKKQLLSLKTSSRRVCKTYSIRPRNTFLRPFQDVFARRLQNILEDTKNVTLKT